MKKIVRIVSFAKQKLIELSYQKSNKKVLMFHEICDKYDEFSITEGHFYDFINEQREIGYIFESVDNIEKYDDAEKVLFITFDDPYESVYSLRHFFENERIPYCVFVSLEYLNKENYLSEIQVSELIANTNCTIGSHSGKHNFKRFEKESVFIEDLIHSKKSLEHMFNVKIKNYAFPYGSIFACSSKNIALAQNHYDRVFMTVPVSVSQQKNDWIGRFNINDGNYRKML